MAIILALDIGKRRTGVAFGDTVAGMMAAIDTVKHVTTEELVDRIRPIVSAKRATGMYVGLPRLPDGTEGEQARYVREVGTALREGLGIAVEFIDERYTTAKGPGGPDPDAQAACAILEVVLDRSQK